MLAFPVPSPRLYSDGFELWGFELSSLKNSNSFADVVEEGLTQVIKGHCGKALSRWF